MIARGVIETLSDMLRQAGFKTKRLLYPASTRRSVDIVARKGRRTILLKAVVDIDSVSRSGIEVLKALSATLSATPILIGVRAKRTMLEDEVVYERHGVPALSLEGFERVIRGDKLYVYSGRGGYYVKINGKKLRELRESRGLSLGDVALYLGVTRRAVYEYEKGSMSASLKVAIRLVELFGEEVLKPLDIEQFGNEYSYPSPDMLIEERLLSELTRSGFKSAHLRNAPVDISASRSEDSKLVFMIRHRREENMEAKVEEAMKIIELVGGKGYLVKLREDKEIEAPEGSLEVISEKDLHAGLLKLGEEGEE